MLGSGSGGGRGMGGGGRSAADTGGGEPVRSSTEKDDFDDDIPF